MTPEPHRHRTLGLTLVLHAFTHIYQVALIPLYLLIRTDFHLASDAQATFLVTAMGIAYFLPSYPLGVLADRVSRKKLLAAGLAINALGFVGLSFAPNYAAALACLLVAGFGGSFFHPAATALIAQLFPDSKGQALGRLGVGASIGFFIGPIYAGWRAGSAGWRQPVLELGLLGLLVAVAFYGMATEHASRRATDSPPAGKIFPTRTLWIFFLAASILFSLRDFAGAGMASLGSLFLQRAHDFSARQTGFALSFIYLASSISNPLFGHLSDRGRIRWTIPVLVIATFVVAIFPRVPPNLVAPTLAIYGFFFMSSYPMVEAALMESVHDSVRGRVFGLFITIAGLLGNLSHWFVGNSVRQLGSAANSPSGYFGLYGLLAASIAVSMIGLVFLHGLRRRENAIAPILTPAVPSLDLEM